MVARRRTRVGLQGGGGGRLGGATVLAGNTGRFWRREYSHRIETTGRPARPTRAGAPGNTAGTLS